MIIRRSKLPDHARTGPRLGSVGQAEIQEAASPSVTSDTLNRTHLASRSEVVRPLADGSAAGLDDGSFMSRETHVQFCEGLGVQFPVVTHLVICCRGGAEQALTTMRDMMSKLKLTVNETKTRVCSLPEEKFDFLGYTFGQGGDP